MGVKRAWLEASVVIWWKVCRLSSQSEHQENNAMCFDCHNNYNKLCETPALKSKVSDRLKSIVGQSSVTSMPWPNICPSLSLTLFLNHSISTQPVVQKHLDAGLIETVQTPLLPPWLSLLLCMAVLHNANRRLSSIVTLGRINATYVVMWWNISGV